MLKTCIIDGYVDEPTCLGVPPYISPYPRYISGAIKKYEKKSIVDYFTIDEIRKNLSILKKLEIYDIIIIIAGVSVPGRYLSGYPASPNELVKFFKDIKKPIKILCGPGAQYGFGMGGGKKTRNLLNEGIFDIKVKGDCETFIHNFLKNNFDKNVDSDIKRENAHSIDDFAKLGTDIVKKHPFYPDYLICEIETYRGCSRSIVGGCSFCSEPKKGTPDFRPIDDIIGEIKNLYNNGIHSFRLGNQPCFFSYMAKEAGKKEFPKPNPEAIKELLSKIRSVAPKLRTLHIDNANPGIIARFPKESKKIAETIIKYHTPGDVAAFGVESVDPKVVKENNLKADEKQVFSAIKLLNDVGKKHGYNGMPELLPGLNFVFGLKGEGKKTFDLNYKFLEKIVKNNLIVRRINLRQIIPIPGTKMYETGNKLVFKHKKDFKHFKYRVKTNIEKTLLERMLPKKTILKDVYTEKHKGKLTFGRQIGSYPLLIGIPGIYKLGTFLDVKVVDYGYRSITAIPYPLDINNTSRETLGAIPGLGKKRINKILLNKPYKNKEELVNIFDDVEFRQKIIGYL